VPGTVRDERRPRDMVVAMLVLLIPIALLLGFYRLMLDGDKPITVDPGPAIEQARAANVFPVAPPVGLDPDKWRVTSARFQRADDGALLRIGYVGPDEEPVQLVQSDIPADRLLRAELGAGARPTGLTVVGTRTWHRYGNERREGVLVLLEPDRTVIVVGHAGIERLSAVAAALP
jgi:Protein of unknown function (DUF4245)